MRFLLAILAGLILSPSTFGQTVTRNVKYATPAMERQVLDIYSPQNATNLPVVFWIHGGGWTQGDKEGVAQKPQAMTGRGYVFVATNYRLLPHVPMETILADVAKSLGWVHQHIKEYGGDPNRIFVMGHSAGAQLAALICTDESYLKAEGVSLKSIKGCVPVDGDTYDIPAIITTAETRARVHEFPPIKNGHREKFGNDPLKHLNFSAISHIAKDKGIPPFLIMYVAGHPDTTAQAVRLQNVLKKHELSVRLLPGKNTDHSKLNNDLGLADDPQTKVLWEFMETCLK